MQRADCMRYSTPLYMRLVYSWISVSVGGGGSQRDFLSFGGVKSYAWIFDCVRGSAPNPHVVRGSNVTPFSHLLGGHVFCRAAIQPTANSFHMAGAGPKMHDLTSFTQRR